MSGDIPRKMLKLNDVVDKDKNTNREVKGKSVTNNSTGGGACDESKTESTNTIPDESKIMDFPCVEPVETLRQLLQYESSNQVLILSFIQNQTKQLATNFSTNVKLNAADGTLRRFSSCPKLLVCHDFRGGYGDDRFIDGTTNPENYTFQHWLQTDIFVYFSHKFVTIPTMGWINAAHSHGVKILGTIITENDDGELMCKELFKDSARIDEVVKKLCAINHDYMFDGYLVNIENPIENPAALIEFIEKLTKELRKSSSKNLVIYYDSIINDGKLKWQNELNELNKPFFDICDGIFLNYCWKDENLEKSIEIANCGSEERSFDVFVGVDVFGRGCFGGGGLSTSLAVEKISATNQLSIAIFAPAWTFESHPYQNYPCMDKEMWSNCSRFFNYRCWTSPKTLAIATTGANEASNLTEFRNLVWCKDIIIQTDFNRGYGIKYFKAFQSPKEKPWFNLTYQSLQPLLLSCDENLKTCTTAADSEGAVSDEVCYNTALCFHGGGCLTFPANPIDAGIIYRVCFPLEIPLVPASNKIRKQFLALLIVWKSNRKELDTLDEAHQTAQKDNKDFKNLSIGLAFAGTDSGAPVRNKITDVEDIFKGILLSCTRNHKMSFHLTDFINLKKWPDSLNPFSKIIFNFDDGNFKDVQCFNDWIFSCYCLDFQILAKHGDATKAIYCGCSKDISIGYFSLLHVDGKDV